MNIVDYGRVCIDLPDINIAAVSLNDVEFVIVNLDTSDLELVADTSETTEASMMFGKVNVGLAASDMTQIQFGLSFQPCNKSRPDLLQEKVHYRLNFE